MKDHKDILIITPSLNPLENISGISTISRLLVEGDNEYNYIPFIVGKKDNEKRGLHWLISILKRPFKFYFSYSKTIDLVHFNIGFEPKSLLRDIFLFFIVTLRHIPVILHIHGGRFMNRKVGGGFKQIILFFLQHSKRIIVLSDIERDFLLLHYPKIRKEDIEVIPNAIVLPDYSMSEKDFSSPLRLLYLGRIDKAKGLSKIADSLNILRNKGIPFTFYLCGVGPDKQEFLNSFPPDISNDIQDMGLVFGEEKQLLLKKSHIFLLPSDFEGLPLALLESMGDFIVPVVSPVGSMPDVVNSKNGRLVTSVEEIVKSIEELNADRSLLASLAQKSHDIVETKYSATQFIEQINRVNATVLA